MSQDRPDTEHLSSSPFPTYTGAMVYGSMIVLLAFAANHAATDRPTTIVSFPDGTTAAVFWEDRQTQEGRDWCRVEFDEPWLSQPRYWQGRESDVVVERRERSADRENRIRAGWEQVGFVEIAGQRIPKSEVEWAERARAMAGFDQEPAPVAEPVPAVAVVKDAPAESLPPSPGFIKLWGAHIAVLGCAALLLAVSLRAFFLTPGK